MSYFLAEVEVSISHYAPEDFEKDGKILKKHLVNAKNEAEVREKVENHYKKESENSYNDTKYDVVGVTIFETIE